MIDIWLYLKGQHFICDMVNVLFPYAFMTFISAKKLDTVLFSLNVILLESWGEAL